MMEHLLALMVELGPQPIHHFTTNKWFLLLGLEAFQMGLDYGVKDI